MTSFREYGPFKGIHNSTNNLTQKQNYVLDSRNVVVNQDNGDIQKRPAAVRVDSLSECIGIAKYISNKPTDSEDLFICGTKNKVKDTVASAPTNVTDFLGVGTFPSKSANDFFSSFMYGGNLYYNYGERVYKYDGRNAQPASIPRLALTEYAPKDTPLLFRVYSCDHNQEVSFITEKEYATALGIPNISGIIPSNSGVNSNFAVCEAISPTNASEVSIPIEALTAYNTLIVGDPVFLLAVPKDYDLSTYRQRRTYER